MAPPLATNWLETSRGSSLSRLQWYNAACITLLCCSSFWNSIPKLFTEVERNRFQSHFCSLYKKGRKIEWDTARKRRKKKPYIHEAVLRKYRSESWVGKDTIFFSYIFCLAFYSYSCASFRSNIFCSVTRQWKRAKRVLGE